MAESACLMRSFTCGMPNEPNNQENNVHALGESVSFGRFTSDSLAWEKWSTFPHKRYVEEAKSYAQPGSVAQKKAFFEAHYKRIAAQKAAAAALLEQENANPATSPKTQLKKTVFDTNLSTHSSSITKSNSNDSPKAVLKSHNFQMTVSNQEHKMARDASKVIDVNPVDSDPKNTESLNKNANLEDDVSVSVDSRTSQTARPLLKSKVNTDQEVTQPMIKKKPIISSLVSSIGKKPSRIPPSPRKFVASMRPKKDHIGTPRTKSHITNDYIDKRKSTPKSISTKPPPTVHNTPKRCATPMKTPTKVFVSGAHKQPLATPCSANRRMETPVHPLADGSKPAGPKWHILSAVSKSLSVYRNKLQSPTVSSPFVLRTEDRAAKRKQKLEEKFNEKEAQKVQQQAKFKEKAETEFRRLRQSFCFKARPLPEFYKEREESDKKILEANPKSRMPRIKAPSLTCSTKNKSSRRLWKNDDQNQNPTHHPLSSISNENTSPNIQPRAANMQESSFIGNNHFVFIES